MSGAPLPLVALRLIVEAHCIGAARFPLAAPRALAFGSRAAAPRTFGRATARAPRRRRCAPRPGASALPPLRPCAAGAAAGHRPPPSGRSSGRTSAPRPPGAGGAAPTRSHRPSHATRPTPCTRGSRVSCSAVYGRAFPPRRANRRYSTAAIGAPPSRHPRANRPASHNARIM